MCMRQSCSGHLARLFASPCTALHACQHAAFNGFLLCSLLLYVCSLAVLVCRAQHVVLSTLPHNPVSSLGQLEFGFEGLRVGRLVG